MEQQMAAERKKDIRSLRHRRSFGSCRKIGEVYLVDWFW